MNSGWVGLNKEPYLDKPLEFYKEYFGIASGEPFSAGSVSPIDPPAKDFLQDDTADTGIAVILLEATTGLSSPWRELELQAEGGETWELGGGGGADEDATLAGEEIQMPFEEPQVGNHRRRSKISTPGYSHTKHSRPLYHQTNTSIPDLNHTSPRNSPTKPTSHTNEITNY